MMTREEYNKFIEEAYVYMYTNNKTTATLLQRRLGRSFNACQGIINELEERGWISKKEGAKKRKLLVCHGCFRETCQCGLKEIIFDEGLHLLSNPQQGKHPE